MAEGEGEGELAREDILLSEKYFIDNSTTRCIF